MALMWNAEIWTQPQTDRLQLSLPRRLIIIIIFLPQVVKIPGVIIIIIIIKYRGRDASGSRLDLEASADQHFGLQSSVSLNIIAEIGAVPAVEGLDARRARGKSPPFTRLRVCS